MHACGCTDMDCMRGSDLRPKCISSRLVVHPQGIPPVMGAHLLESGAVSFSNACLSSFALPCRATPLGNGGQSPVLPDALRWQIARVVTNHGFQAYLQCALASTPCCPVCWELSEAAAR